MKSIKAYKCDYCKKILSSYSGMWKHEKKCFFNPESRSCVTCEKYHDRNLGIKDEYGVFDRFLTEEEHLIIECKVPGTFTIHYDEWDDFDKLKPEFQYLYEAEVFSKCELIRNSNKLKTQCKLHKLVDYLKVKQK